MPASLALQKEVLNQTVTGTQPTARSYKTNLYEWKFQQLLAIQIYCGCYSWVQLHGLSKTFKNYGGLRQSQAACQCFILQGICIYNSCYLTQQILARQLLENLCWGLHFQDLHQSLTKFESICMASLFKPLLDVLCFNVLRKVYYDKLVKVLLVGQ